MTGVLSLAARAALDTLRAHGCLKRLPGGYWVAPHVRFAGMTPNAPWHNAPAIDALVAHGLARVSAYERRVRGRTGGSPCEVEAC